MMNDENMMTVEQLQELVRNEASKTAAETIEKADIYARLDATSEAISEIKARMVSYDETVSRDMAKMVSGWGDDDGHAKIEALHRWVLGKTDPSRKAKLSPAENAALIRQSAPAGVDVLPLNLGGPAIMENKDFAAIADDIIGTADVAWLPTQMVETAIKDTSIPHTRYVRANARIHNMTADVHVLPLAHNPYGHHWTLVTEGTEPDVFPKNLCKEELRWSKKVHIEALYDVAEIRSGVDLSAWLSERCLAAMLNAEEYAAWRSTAAVNDQFIGIAPMVAPDALTPASPTNVWSDLTRMKQQVGPYNVGAAYFCGDALWYNLLQAFSRAGLVGVTPQIDIQGASPANAFTVQGLGTFYRHSLLDITGDDKSPDPGQSWKGWIFYGSLSHYHIGQVGNGKIPLFGLQVLGPGSSYVTFMHQFSLFKVAVLNGGLLNYGAGEIVSGAETGCPRITWSAINYSAIVDQPIKICIPSEPCS